MKTLLRKEIERTIAVILVVGLIGLLLSFVMPDYTWIGVMALLLLLYLLYMGHSENTYMSIPNKAKAFIKENELGDIIGIEDVKEAEKSYGTCEYDIVTDHYVTKTILTSNGKKVKVKEAHINSANEYRCNCWII